MELQRQNMYSEVYEMIKMLNENDVKKIPNNYIEIIENNRNKEYVPKIEKEKIKITISKEARALYIWLYLKFISNNATEKDQILSKLYENETIKSQKYNSEVFNKKEINVIKPNEEIQVYKENWFNKIVKKLRKIFNINN